MTIHLFGASGFIGRSLLPLLEKGDEKAVGHSSKSLDLTSPESAQRIAHEVKDGDTVILLSGLTPEKGKAVELTLLNLLMAKHLLAGLEKRHLAQLVYISSDAVYPLTADMVDENTPACPYSLYGQMHVMREQMFKEHFSPQQLTILRPCAVYGLHDSHNAYSINRFIRSARERGVIELFGGGEEYRDHIHVDDFAAIAADAVRRRIPGLYNAATGHSRRFSEIARMVQQSYPGATIVNKPRSMPVYHRHVDMSRTHSAFPSCLLRSIETGVMRLIQEMA